jgi:spermidine synthase
MNRTPVLFLNVLVIAVCGLVYELLAGTLASYVLGDSVTQFSIVIGIYLSALGVGAWLSRFIDNHVARAFLEVELGVALLGGFSAPLLFLCFARFDHFLVFLVAIVFAIGVLVGLELPLVMRIVRDHLDFKDLVSRVLAFDYIGALAASLLFPLFCVPRLGLIRTSLVFGMLNAGVALWGTWILRPLLGRAVHGLRLRALFVLVLLGFALVHADYLTNLAEEQLFPDDIRYAQTTPYQRIVITSKHGEYKLFLNGHLQFASADEYRYHEALVHPAMALVPNARRVLVLGGGDGLALREILKYSRVEAVTLVDLDPAMTTLWQRFPPLAELSRRAYEDPRVTVVNQDAFLWVDGAGAPYDVVVIDFPDPSTFSLGKLYTTRFYKLLRRRLTPEGVVSIQCTSPLMARKSYWCIVKTMEAAGFAVQPYHAAVPSFGVWGFALARQSPFDPPKTAPPSVELRFVNDAMLPGLFALPADLLLQPGEEVEINRLDNQALVRYHDAEWRKWE